jgi:hypothetical protein
MIGYGFADGVFIYANVTSKQTQSFPEICVLTAVNFKGFFVFDKPGKQSNATNLIGLGYRCLFSFVMAITPETETLCFGIVCVD